MTIQKQKGFTLIELVVVIVILGILAVTAAPKFLDLSDEAKTSAIYGLAGNMRSALDITYAQALMEGKEKNGGNLYDPPATINVDGNDIEIMYGYPVSSDDLAAVVTGLEDWKMWNYSQVPYTQQQGIYYYGFEGFDCLVSYKLAKMTTEEVNGVVVKNNYYPAQVTVLGSECTTVDEETP